MKKILGFTLMLLVSMLYAADAAIMKNGEKAWSDRNYIISELPGTWQFSKPVPVQKCTGYSLSLPTGTKQALIGLFSSPEERKIAEDAG